MKFKHNSKMSKFCYEAPAASVATLTGSEIPATVVSVGRCPACTVGDVARVILFTTVLLGTEGTLPGNTVACVAEKLKFTHKSRYYKLSQLMRSGTFRPP